MYFLDLRPGVLAMNLGCAALLAKSVVAATTVAWDDLGTEALRRLDVVDFPCFVAVDTLGNDVYAQVQEAGRA